jgi:threonylcarbamoyladenosine tRNA methylthiotransferase MtaB
MPQVPPALVRERAARLREAGAAALAGELRARIGTTDDVLVERPGSGRTGFYAGVRFAAAMAEGTVRRMRFVDVVDNSLVGVPVA